jgi:hypothetical protein
MRCTASRADCRCGVPITPKDLLTLVSENADRLTHRAFLARQRGAKTSGRGDTFSSATVGQGGLDEGGNNDVDDAGMPIAETIARWEGPTHRRMGQSTAESFGKCASLAELLTEVAPSRMTPPAIQVSVSRPLSKRSPARVSWSRGWDLGGAHGYSQADRITILESLSESTMPRCSFTG